MWNLYSLSVTAQLQHLFIPALQHRETQADELQMQSARVPGTREIIFPEDTLQNFSYRLPNKQCKTVFFMKKITKRFATTLPRGPLRKKQTHQGPTA